MSHTIEVAAGGTTARLVPSAWSRNGPEDQQAFHRKLIQLQLQRADGSTPDLTTSYRRMALLEAVQPFGVPALQELERPRPTARSWSSNYGPHGWHRYVGRFPPHVIRSLLNHFGCGPDTQVLDPFVGSGTTAVEGRLLGVPVTGIEICPLSALIARTKAHFPDQPDGLLEVAGHLERFYSQRWQAFVQGRDAAGLEHAEILAREGNPVPRFANIERWFGPEALLGASIVVEFSLGLEGTARDAVLCALSARMRSIGNVDVDVVRAEYRKQPRSNVRVERLVHNQLLKMARDVRAVSRTHGDLVGASGSVHIIEDSALDVDLPQASIDTVITSPPYGVESISYLRTHLLSYRALAAELQQDPYDERERTIGSEYLAQVHSSGPWRAEEVSPLFREFFSETGARVPQKQAARRLAMMRFFDDMDSLTERLSGWMKDGARMAFIVGNKKLGEHVIPTDRILGELFAAHGIEVTGRIEHKLKTNNSNSQVPWQERIIQQENILLCRRAGRQL